MSELERALTVLLDRYMPAILAQSVKRRALAAVGVAEGQLRDEHLPTLRRQLESGIRLFVDAGAQSGLMAEIDALCSGRVASAEAAVVPVRVEADIVEARGRARELMMALGGGAFPTQRAATVASELARNIVAYAGEGVLELIPRPERPLLTIVARDQGPGIADVEAILEGRYRSKTGLGMGLRGVQRLAARFELSTSARGTRVEADLAI
ncbi:MAG: hypothetical protein KF901_11095 [Myxococcales bacterium]|nr:hypothetical protein [Myxococcales bacterium]